MDNSVRGKKKKHFRKTAALQEPKCCTENATETNLPSVRLITDFQKET